MGEWGRWRASSSGEELQSVCALLCSRFCIHVFCLEAGFCYFFKKNRILKFAKSIAILTSSLQPGRTLENPAFADAIQEVVERFFPTKVRRSQRRARVFFFFFVLIAALTPTPPDACYATFFSLLKVSMWA